MPHQTTVLSVKRRSSTPSSSTPFFGILPFCWVTRATSARAGVRTTPLMVTSRDTAPSGWATAAVSRAGAAARRRVEPVGAEGLAAAVAEHRQLPANHANGASCRCSFWIPGYSPSPPTVPEFDYPRGDLPAHVRYVGAVHPTPAGGVRLPPWWAELDGDRPVVHVTQGTLDNADLGLLVEPTIEALGDQDVIVVASTGGRDVSALKKRLPINTFVAEHSTTYAPKVTRWSGAAGAATRIADGVPLSSSRQHRRQTRGRRARGVDRRRHQSTDRRADSGRGSCRGARGTRRRPLPRRSSTARDGVRRARRCGRGRGARRRGHR